MKRHHPGMTIHMHMHQGSPEWRAMLKEALDIIAAMEGGAAATQAYTQEVHERITRGKTTGQILSDLACLANAGLTIAHAACYAYVTEQNEEDDDGETTTSIPSLLRSIEQGILEALDGPPDEDPQ